MICSVRELIVLCGLPGSGKSTYTRKKFGDTHVVICADEFRKIHTGRDFYPPAECVINQMVRVTVEVLLRRSMPVVIDMTCLTVTSRLKWIDLAKRCDAPVRCLWMDIATSVCLERNARRERKVPADVIDAMATRFIPPLEGEGFDTITRVTEWAEWKRGNSLVGLKFRSHKPVIVGSNPTSPNFQFTNHTRGEKRHEIN